VCYSCQIRHPEPEGYGFLDLITSEDGTGMRGGAVGGPGYQSQAVFYVRVPNVEAALQRGERLGAHGCREQPGSTGLLGAVGGPTAGHRPCLSPRVAETGYRRPGHDALR